MSTLRMVRITCDGPAVSGPSGAGCPTGASEESVGSVAELEAILRDLGWSCRPTHRCPQCRGEAS